MAMSETVTVKGRIMEVRDLSIEIHINKTPDWKRFWVPRSLIAKTDNVISENKAVVLSLPEWFCKQEAMPYKEEG